MPASCRHPCTRAPRNRRACLQILHDVRHCVTGTRLLYATRYLVCRHPFKPPRHHPQPMNTNDFKQRVRKQKHQPEIEAEEKQRLEQRERTLLQGAEALRRREVLTSDRMCVYVYIRYIYIYLYSDALPVYLSTCLSVYLSI